MCLAGYCLFVIACFSFVALVVGFVVYELGVLVLVGWVWDLSCRLLWSFVVLVYL